MKVQKKIGLFYLCFLLLIIFSLTQGYYCKYLRGKVCNDLFLNYWSENGFIENLQIIFVLLAIILLIKVRYEFKKFNLINFFILIKTLALIYYLGEEISWGQHFFKWETPSLLEEINNQKETNIHNISNLFDQLPRTLVFFWCAFGIILINFLKNKIKINKNYIYLIKPNKNLIYISFLLIILSFPDLLISILNLHPGHVDKFGEDMPESVFFDIITFNFVRLSELHELVFCFYFLNYSIFINQIKEKILIN